MTMTGTAEPDVHGKPRLAVVGIVGLPSSYGGWETLASNILPALVERFDVTVYCSAKRYEDKPATYEGARLEYINFDANSGKAAISSTSTGSSGNGINGVWQRASSCAFRNGWACAAAML